jgi:hypothetical protein
MDLLAQSKESPPPTSLLETSWTNETGTVTNLIWQSFGSKFKATKGRDLNCDLDICGFLRLRGLSGGRSIGVFLRKFGAIKAIDFTLAFHDGF